MQYPIRSLLMKKDLNILIGCKDTKKIRPLCIFLPENDCI